MSEGKRFSDEMLQNFYEEFKDHLKDEAEWRETYMSAFPYKDPVLHRQHHEAMIRAAEAQEKFWSELRLDMAKKSFWALLMLVIGLVASGAVVKLGLKL